MPYAENPNAYHKYVLVDDFSKLKDYAEACDDVQIKEYVYSMFNNSTRGTAVLSGVAAPVKGWGSGGAIQYKLPIKLDMLIRIGLVEEIY